MKNYGIAIIEAAETIKITPGDMNGVRKEWNQRT